MDATERASSNTVRRNAGLSRSQQRTWLRLVKAGAPPQSDRAKKRFLKKWGSILGAINAHMAGATVAAEDFIKNGRDQMRHALERISLFLVDGELAGILTELDRSGEDLLRFMGEEGISREYEGPVNREWHFWLVAFFGFGEFAAAFWFLNQFAASPGLALAGAAIPAAITVVLSGLAVEAGRQWLRPGRRRQLLAVLGVLASVVFAGAGHMAMAHGREDLITGDVGGTALAFRVLEAPFELSGESLGFLFMSVLAFGLCCWEWVKSDDIYPGLGAKWRRVRRAESQRDAKLNEIRDEIYGAIHGTMQERSDELRRVATLAKTTLQDIENALIQVGVSDPGSLDVENETDPARIHMIQGWHKAQALIQACSDLGDVFYVLSRREDEMDDEHPEAIEIEHLSEAVRVEEGRRWLERYVASFSAEDDSENEGEDLS